MAQARTHKASGESSTIGSGARIRGRVTGDGNVVVAGHVEGDILVRGDVTIADGASCTSNVEGHEVSVSGTLSGDVSASGPVTIGATARVRGNVRGSSIALEDGAAFAGRIDCDFELPDGLGDARAPAATRRR
ncbi:MAG: bactofilin family protein [Polyangiaceae bacterium]|jgi:cytoskeletal protein CcmA (bactofilin family)